MMAALLDRLGVEIWAVGCLLKRPFSPRREERALARVSKDVPGCSGTIWSILRDAASRLLRMKARFSSSLQFNRIWDELRRKASILDAWRAAIP